jgi:hypothetical protein
VTPAPSQATIAATNWFSSTRSWLNEFDGPLATAAQDVLVGVQRTLFSPAPTVKPVQYSIWTPEEPILGALKYVQPGGAAVSMQLTQAPTFGTVQLLSSGAYTYTPGPDFTGTDSFTAEVTAGGFNLLEPFTPRTSSVAVRRRSLSWAAVRALPRHWRLRWWVLAVAARASTASRTCN